MHNSYELIHQAFAFIMFCSAVTFLLLTYRTYSNALQVSQKLIKEDILYEQYNEAKEKSYSKGEVLSLFLAKLDYDLEIDGLLISKTENIKDGIPTYSIPDHRYKKTYAYDSSGKITRVIFTSIDNEDKHSG